MNRHILLIGFANFKGIEAPTERDLFNLQNELSDFFRKKDDPIIEELLQKHGITLPQWRSETLDRMSHFWACPTKEEAEINEEIKRTLKAHWGFLPPQTLYSRSVFSGQLSGYMKKTKDPKIIRWKDSNNIWRYQLILGYKRWCADFFLIHS